MTEQKLKHSKEIRLLYVYNVTRTPVTFYFLER